MRHRDIVAGMSVLYTNVPVTVVTPGLRYSIIEYKSGTLHKAYNRWLEPNFIRHETTTLATVSKLFSDAEELMQSIKQLYNQLSISAVNSAESLSTGGFVIGNQYQTELGPVLLDRLSDDGQIAYVFSSERQSSFQLSVDELTDV